MPVSANAAGCAPARCGLMLECGSSRCTRPATPATSSHTQTATQLPSACVMTTDSRSLDTANSPIPTIRRRRCVSITAQITDSDMVAPLVDCRCNPPQAMGDAIQALSMRDEEIPARLQVLLEHGHD